MEQAPPNPRPAMSPFWVSFCLGMLVTCNFVNWMDRQLLAAVVPAVKAEFLTNQDHPTGGGILHLLHPGQDASGAALGMLALAFMVAYMVLAPIFGVLPYRRWRIIGFGIIVWSLATGMSGFAGTFGLLLLSRFLVGVGEAAHGPLAPAMIADLYKEKRATKMALFMLAMPVGSAVGYILGGVINATLGWRWAFYLPVIPGLILGVMCFFMPEPIPTETERKKVSFLQGFSTLMKTPSFLLVMGAMTAMCYCIGALGYWMPSYATETRQAGSLATVNLIFGLIVLVTGIGATYFGGVLVDRLRPRIPNVDFLLPAAALALGTPLFIAALYVPFPYAWFLIAVTCAVLFAGGAPMNTIIANVVSPSQRAVAYGVNILVVHLLGDAISPMIVGATADASSMHVAFMSLSLVVVIAIVCCLIGSRFIVKDMQTLEKQNAG